MRNKRMTTFAGVAALSLATLLQTTALAQAVNFIEMAKKHPDFAELEFNEPLSQQYLDGLTPESFKTMDQETIDRIYARITAGPIPDGRTKGLVVFAKGSDFSTLVHRFRGILHPVDAVKDHVVKIWSGKTFEKANRMLRNQVLGVLGFPAKVYCGVSLLDTRRESIIIDYAHADELPGYFHIRDQITTREGLDVRDEIRMVKPGLYLGRAYVGRAFVLNFVLQQEGAITTGPEECWQGTQVRRQN